MSLLRKVKNIISCNFLPLIPEGKLLKISLPLGSGQADFKNNYFSEWTHKLIFTIAIVFCCADMGFSQQQLEVNRTIVKKFYDISLQPIYWLSSEKHKAKAMEWLTVLNLSGKSGFESNKSLMDEIRVALYSPNLNDSVKKKVDEQITEIVLIFLKFLQEGNTDFKYDEISVNRDSVYIYQVLNQGIQETVSSLVSHIECSDRDYIILKNYLNDSILNSDTLKRKMLLSAMNYRRYLSLNHFSEYIVVNIPAAEAEYYNNDSLYLKMRTVVGRKSKPTPVFASYITNIVTFPYWSVPRSIAVKEILPKVKKQPDYLEKNNFEVTDAKGNVVEDSALKWNDYNTHNFPYYFRQSTGDSNALGVLKFNLQNPFSIFLHATSLIDGFAKENRFLSHGCIRLEKPFDLAYELLKGKINIEELKNGKNNTPPDTIALHHKVPVFIIYMPVIVSGTKVSFLSDKYELFK